MKPSEIKAIRAIYSLSRYDLAQILGVNKQTIYFWETSRTKPLTIYLVVLQKFWDTIQNDKKRDKVEKAIKLIKLHGADTQNRQELLESLYK